jgi:aminopeptidase N
MQARYLILLCLTGIMLMNVSCKKSGQKAPEKGVSFALNEYRKRTIDSIHYAVADTCLQPY